MKVSVAQLSSNPNDISEVDSAIDKIGPNLVNELVEDLDEIILSLAKKIGRKTYRDTKQRLGVTMSTRQLKQLEKLAEKMLHGMHVVNAEPNQSASAAQASDCQ